MDRTDGSALDLAFLRSYEATTLRRIEVVSDALLERLFLADAGQRALLAAQLLSHLAEAAQRLVAVCSALRDRRSSVAVSLRQQLPTADGWRAFSEAVSETDPGELVRAMGLDDRAWDSADELSRAPELWLHSQVIRVHESGPPLTRLEGGERPALLFEGRDRSGRGAELRVALSEARITAIADATGQLVAIARDFLITHIELREESLAEYGAG